MQAGRSNKHSFTLIEMLVVMVIILVLAGLLLPVVQMSKNSADQARAKETVNQMAAAFRAYLVEFGRWPTPVVTTNLSGSCANSVDFCITTNLFANSSGITFFDFSAKDILSNAVYNGLIVDPWKSPYFCRLDTNYTGSVCNPFYSTAHMLPVGFAIWSLGNDGTMSVNVSGDTSLLNKDNPKSW